MPGMRGWGNPPDTECEACSKSMCTTPGALLMSVFGSSQWHTLGPCVPDSPVESPGFYSWLYLLTSSMALDHTLLVSQFPQVKNQETGLDIFQIHLPSESSMCL